MLGKKKPLVKTSGLNNGGGSEIRTHGGRKPSPVFKTDHILSIIFLIFNQFKDLHTLSHANPPFKLVLITIYYHLLRQSYVKVIPNIQFFFFFTILYKIALALISVYCTICT